MPYGAPLPESNMVCCDTWCEGRRTGPVPGCVHSRKLQPINGGRPSGPMSPRRPTSLSPSVVTRAWRTVYIGINGWLFRETPQQLLLCTAMHECSSFPSLMTVGETDHRGELVPRIFQCVCIPSYLPS